MDCREFRETFSDYVDAALDADAEACVRRHLAACSACRRFERAYRAGIAALQALPVLAPARDFGARVVNRARRAPARPMLAVPPALAASLAAVALVGGLVVDFRRHAPALGDAETAAVPAGQAPESRPRAVERTDFVTVRVAQDDDISYKSPYASFQVTDSFSAVRVRFDVPAVWSGR
jgi:anti-sigma factor RsiW